MFLWIRGCCYDWITGHLDFQARGSVHKTESSLRWNSHWPTTMQVANWKNLQWMFCWIDSGHIHHRKMCLFWWVWFHSSPYSWFKIALTSKVNNWNDPSGGAEWIDLLNGYSWLIHKFDEWRLKKWWLGKGFAIQMWAILGILSFRGVVETSCQLVRCRIGCLHKLLMKDSPTCGTSHADRKFLQ